MSQTKRKIRILVPYINLLSFIQKDIDILSLEHHVVTVKCRSLIEMLKAVRRVIWADCVFCWFASLRFLPLVIAARAMGKKIIIVTGGYDAANLPEIGYGNMYGSFSKYLGRFIFSMAHVIACISKSNYDEIQKNAKVKADRLSLIYLGFDAELVDDISYPYRKENFVLTVGHINMCTIYRKGLLAIAKVSVLLPDVRFVFAGSFNDNAMEILRKAASDNVTFAGYVSIEKLQDLFMRAKVYMQPSLHEAFGCSVAEAMLYNCIPIVSNRFSLPEVVGKSGFYVDPYDIHNMVSTVRLALDSEYETNFPESPRQRIIRMFPIAKHNELILKLVEDICAGI